MNSFFPLDVMDQVNISNLLFKIDKCNGYVIDTRSEEKRDIREQVFQQSELSKNQATLSKFEMRREMTEEELMMEELKKFESFANGEITEEELYS